MLPAFLGPKRDVDSSLSSTLPCYPVDQAATMNSAMLRNASAKNIEGLCSAQLSEGASGQARGEAAHSPKHKLGSIHLPASRPLRQGRRTPVRGSSPLASGCSRTSRGLPRMPLNAGAEPKLPETGLNEDDSRQKEAMDALTALCGRSTSAQYMEGVVGKLETELKMTQVRRHELEELILQERNLKEAALQQVQCLEGELDGKEAALQVAERALERRERHHRETSPSPPPPSASAHESRRLDKLRSRLREREQQLEMKERHIDRLLGALRRHHTSSNFTDDDATTAGSTFSEQSMPTSSFATGSLLSVSNMGGA